MRNRILHREELKERTYLIKRMHSNGISISEIATMTGYPYQEIESLIKS